MSQAPLRGVILGFGSIGPVHLTCVNGSEDGQVSRLHEGKITGVADLSPEVRGRIPEGLSRYGSFEEVVNDGDVDVVHVCLPHHLHKPAVIAVAEAGKSIICEKPMALDAPEAREMARIIGSNDVSFSLISQNRLNPEKEWLKAQIDAGKLGNIERIDADIDWFRDSVYYAASGGWRGRDSEARGGVLTNQAYHTLDLIIWMLGELPVSITGHSSTDSELHPENDVPDEVSAEIAFPSGAVCNFHATTCGNPKDPITVSFDGSGSGLGPERVVVDGSSVLECSLEGGIPSTSDHGPQLGKSAYGGSHQANIALSYQAFLKGEDGPVGAEDGIRALTVIDAMLNSKGKPINLVHDSEGTINP